MPTRKRFILVFVLTVLITGVASTASAQNYAAPGGIAYAVDGDCGDPDEAQQHDRRHGQPDEDVAGGTGGGETGADGVRGHRCQVGGDIHLGVVRALPMVPVGRQRTEGYR